MAVTALGTSGAAMPVSLTTTTSQASRSAVLLQQRGEVRGAGLLLALDQQLDGDGGGVAAGGGEVRAHAEQVEGDVALVVDRAAGVQLGAVGARRRGWARTAGAPTARAGRPAGRRGGRRRARPARRRRREGHSAKTAGAPGGRPDLHGREAGAAQRLGQPGGALGDVRGVRGVGRDRRDAQPGVEIGVQVVEVGVDEVAFGAARTAARR